MAGFLQEERALLEKHLPKLGEKLAGAELSDLERPESPAIEWFREAGGPALFVPADLGGLGVGLGEGVRLQRAIACRAPSLAVATTMHHFSVASLLDLEDITAHYATTLERWRDTGRPRQAEPRQVRPGRIEGVHDEDRARTGQSDDRRRHLPSVR